MKLNQFLNRLRSLPAALPKLKKPKKADWFLLIVSFAAALILWVNLAPTISVPTFYIGVSGDLSETKADLEYNLQLLPESADELNKLSVECTINGPRTLVGGLSEKNVEAYVDYDEASDVIGTQKLPLRLRTTDGRPISADNVEITLKPATCTVNLDRSISKSVPVSKTVSHSELKLPDDNNITRINEEGITVEPATIVVEGPSTKLDQIDHISVRVESSQTLTKSETFNDVTQYALIDKNGNEIDNSRGYFTVQKPYFSVYIPVYYQNSMPVTVNITDIPLDENGEEDADIRQFLYERIRLRTTGGSFTLPGYGDNDLSISLRTDDPLLKENLQQESFSLTSLQRGAIPVVKDAGEKPKEVQIETKDYENVSKFSSVEVCMDGTDLEKLVIPVPNSEIDFQHKIPDYDYQLDVPNGFTDVTIIGTQEELAKITLEDLRVSADMFSVVLKGKSEQKNVPVKVQLPDGVKYAWVSQTEKTAPSVDLNISEKG